MPPRGSASANLIMSAYHVVRVSRSSQNVGGPARGAGGDAYRGLRVAQAASPARRSRGGMPIRGRRRPAAGGMNEESVSSGSAPAACPLPATRAPGITRDKKLAINGASWRGAYTTPRQRRWHHLEKPEKAAIGRGESAAAGRIMVDFRESIVVLRPARGM